MRRYIRKYRTRDPNYLRLHPHPHSSQDPVSVIGGLGLGIEGPGTPALFNQMKEIIIIKIK